MGGVRLSADSRMMMRSCGDFLPSCCERSRCQSRKGTRAGERVIIAPRRSLGGHNYVCMLSTVSDWLRDLSFSQCDVMFFSYQATLTSCIFASRKSKGCSDKDASRNVAGSTLRPEFRGNRPTYTSFIFVHF
jgi:hypothetical protein